MQGLSASGRIAGFLFLVLADAFLIAGAIAGSLLRTCGSFGVGLAAGPGPFHILCGTCGAGVDLGLFGTLGALGAQALGLG